MVEIHILVKKLISKSLKALYLIRSGNFELLKAKVALQLKLTEKKLVSETGLAQKISYFENFENKRISKKDDYKYCHNSAKVITFYLPQFHAIPENNEWWGEGFTEWINVKPASPKFSGHYQPRKPTDMGYYDLLEENTFTEQIDLAKLYGVEGFCFYFYWFDGKRLLEQPLLNYLEDKTLDFPFCLCWANENWSRRWDGLDSDILIGQNHSDEDDIAFISYLSKYLMDDRYIQIDGKPLVLVYRPHLLPDAKNTTARWRKWCIENGVGEIYLAYTQSFENVSPLEYGFDAAIEFPPNNSAPPLVTDEQIDIVEGFSGQVYDWNVFMERSESYVEPDYKLFRSVTPMWDNTARKKNNGTIFVNSSPEKYGVWLRRAINQAVKTAHTEDEKIVFVNAWNEWAEGAYLEPDEKYGYAYLEATRIALLNSSLSQRKVSLGNNDTLAIVIHAFYLDVLDDILLRLCKLQQKLKIYLTTSFDKKEDAEQLLQKSGLEFELLALENRGRDIKPFLNILPSVFENKHKYLIKLHTKKSTHRQDGDIWRDDLFEKLLSIKSVTSFISRMDSDMNIGLIGPSGHIVPMSTYWGSNEDRVVAIAARLGILRHELEKSPFIAGSMFIARVECLLPIASLAIDPDDFENEAGQVDGTLAHAIERVFSISLLSTGYKLASTDREELVLKNEYDFADASS